MFVEIRAESSFVWEIDYDDDDGKHSALLEQNGGSWYLTARSQSGKRNIAGPRIEWPEALKRALIALAPKVN